MSPPSFKTVFFYSFFGMIPIAYCGTVFRLNEDIPIPNTFTGVYLDLVSGFTHFSDTTGFSNTQVNFFFGGAGIGSDEDFLPARVAAGQLEPIKPANFGEIVPGTLDFGPEGDGASADHVSNTPTGEQFESGVPGYIAFQLDLNEDGNYVAGWMRVTLTNGSSEGVIHGWAYSDTPGEPLAVGIPEPSSALLALFVTFPVLFVRRRRAC